jgi:hypothetical protein
MLDSAMCSLLGSQNHMLLKAAFHDAKEIQAIFKVSSTSKVTLAIDQATVQSMECLLKCDPELSSFTTSDLLSFISKSKLILTLYMVVVHSLHHRFFQLSQQRFGAKIQLKWHWCTAFSFLSYAVC